MRPLLLAMLLMPLVGSTGCSKPSRNEAAQAAPAAPAAPALEELTVDELAEKLARGECRAVDANIDATRKRLGVIPGAVLLSDSETYLPSELPADKSKPLVFYCTNEHCTASDEAAARAITAGYTNVKVLPAGIVGWNKAGKQTAKL